MNDYMEYDVEAAPEASGEKTGNKILWWEKKTWSVVFSLLMVVLITLLGKRYGDYLGLTNMGMLYLLPVVFASARLGVTPSVIIALISVISFDIFFVPPMLKLTVNDIRYLITFVVFMVVAFTTGNIADHLRFRIKESLHRETRTRALYNLARGLSAVTDMDLLARQVVDHVSQTIATEVALYLPEKNGSLKIAAASKAFSDLVLGPNDLAAADWAFKNSQHSGVGTDAFPGAKGFYLPVQTEAKTLGVLGVKPTRQLFSAEQTDLLEALAGLAALAIGRLQLAAEAQAIKAMEESERLRTALFNSISHEMKTPLASILGAVSSLVDDEALYNEEQKSTLLLSIKQGALRMNRVVGNLLDMARLESGYIRLNTDWCDIQDIIGVTLRENRDILHEHQVKINIPENISLIRVDYGLIEQVLNNLLHNAVKYSPSGSEIEVSVREAPGELQVSIADQGPGVAASDEKRIFNKFYRFQSPGHVSGTGLGLSICRGIIEAHRGLIWAKNRPDGGLLVSFTLPVDNSSQLLEPIPRGE